MTRWSEPRPERMLVLAGALGLGAVALYACSTGQPRTVGPAGSSEAAGASPAAGAAACSSDPAAAAHDAEVVAAARAFVATLTDTQKSAVRVDRTRSRAVQWSNFPADVVRRNGVRLADLGAAAHAAAIELVEAAAGTRGAELFSEVRLADEAFARGHGAALFGADLYYISLHGEPTPTADWMLQVAGHHFAYNFTYSGQCTSATPLFDGAQPAKFTDASGRPHDPLAEQRNAVAALFGAVGPKPGARLTGTFSDMVNGPAGPGGGATSDRPPPNPGVFSPGHSPFGGPPDGGPGGRPGGGEMSGGTDSNYPDKLTYPTRERGACVATFSGAERALVRAAIESWVHHAGAPVAASLLAAYETEAALDRTYVGFSGQADLSTTRSYARIDGPRVWIEFTVQEGTTNGLSGHYPHDLA